LAQHQALVTERGSTIRPKRARVVELYTEPPPDSTVICVDELGPVSPRSFPPAPGWSIDGHRIKAPLEYGRGLGKTWVYGALRGRDGQVLTRNAPSRNTQGYLRLLEEVERANPSGNLYLITDNLTSHKSPPIREWLAAHPRVEQHFIPKGAAWLNLIEGWWRLFRKEALAGQNFIDTEEIELATRVATKQLNGRAKPWIWGRPPKPRRHRRRRFVYHL
jgi:DDE superfamily endonuclease